MAHKAAALAATTHLVAVAVQLDREQTELLGKADKAAEAQLTQFFQEHLEQAEQAAKTEIILIRH